MRNSIKIWIIAVCVMLIMVLTGVVGWTIGYQDHKKIDQTSKNLSEMTEETKEEMIQETTVTMTEEMTEEIRHLRMISCLRHSLIQEALIHEKIIIKMTARKMWKLKKILNLQTAS